MPHLATIRKNLETSRVNLLRVADAIPALQWRTSPGNSSCSAAEVIAHLTMVERGVTGKADRVVQHPPRRVSAFGRLHLPVRIVEHRILRRKTPIPLDPAMLGEKEEMLAALRHARERTLIFLDETRDRNLREYFWPHPFLGNLNFYNWFQMIASHEVRHTKQIQEMVEALRKL